MSPSSPAGPAAGEMPVPEAGHLAHLLAWGIEATMDMGATIGMPFYSPDLQARVAWRSG